MIIDFYADHFHARLYSILDLDTGRGLDDEPLFYADDEAGLYRVLLKDAGGEFFLNPSDPRELAWGERRARIKLCLRSQYESEEQAMAQLDKAIMDMAFASVARTAVEASRDQDAHRSLR